MFKKLILISLLMLTGHMHAISALQWEVEDADNAGAVGIHTSIALDSSGLPHISYYDVDDEYLKYAYKDSQGWHTTVVDTAGYRGRVVFLDCTRSCRTAADQLFRCGRPPLRFSGR